LRRAYYRLPACGRGALATIYSLSQRGNRYGGVFKAQLSELRQHATRSPEEHAQEQGCRLANILLHAKEHVPYYRDLMAGVGRESILRQPREVLRRLPVLDKETVRARLDEIRADGFAGRLLETHTSGTTGKGLHLVISQEAYQRSYACVWFHYAMAGIERGDRIATLAGHPVANPNVLEPPFWVYDRSERELLFSSQHLAPETLGAYAEALAKFSPTLIRGYPSSIYFLAQHLLEKPHSQIRPRAVFTSSETLMSRQRKTIEAAFGCRVFSYYSNTERVAHIVQCMMGQYHVISDACVVEVLKPSGELARADEEGEMVCTGLLDRALPLLRYRVGDTAIAAPAACPCGYNTPVLGLITGRVEDVVITPDGRRVGRLDHAFKDMLNVVEAQIVQNEVRSIEVKIVPRDQFGPADMEMLVSELRLRLGPTIAINVQRVAAIPRTTTGKFRFLVSNLATTRTSGGP